MDTNELILALVETIVEQSDRPGRDTPESQPQPPRLRPEVRERLVRLRDALILQQTQDNYVLHFGDNETMNLTFGDLKEILAVV